MSIDDDTHSKLIGYLTWIFGFIGAHRFYYGRQLTGTLYFFTLGLLLIGWIVDLFLIPSMDRAADRRYRSMVDVYESGYGVCTVVMSRWLNPGTVLLLDSSRVALLPLTGRSFGYQSLATVGDSVRGQIIGEYTLEMRSELAHGMITGLETTTE